MKKSKKTKANHAQRSNKILIFCGIIFSVSILVLTLVNTFYYQVFTPISINKIVEVDPSTAKTAVEKKIINRVNTAAQKEPRFKTDSVQHQRVVKELYIAGEMLNVAKATGRDQIQGKKDDVLIKEFEKQAITNLKTGKYALVGSSEGSSLVSGAKNTPILNDDESLREEANLPITRISNPSSASRGVGSTIPQSGLPYSNNSQTEACKVNPTSFGCAYPPGFVYTGDDKCGGSVAGYYCWKDAKDGVYKYYVVNLPATMAEYNKRLVSANNAIGSYTGDGSDKSIAAYLNSLGIYDQSSIAKLGAEIKKKVPATPPDPAGGTGSNDKQKYEDLKSKYQSIPGGILNSEADKAVKDFYLQYEKDNKIGKQYGAEFITQAEFDRTDPLSKLAKQLVADKKTVAPVIVDGKKVTVAQSVDGGRKYTTYTFGDGITIDEHVPTSGNINNEVVSQKYTAQDIEDAKNGKDRLVTVVPIVIKEDGNVGGTVYTPSDCKYKGAKQNDRGTYSCPEELLPSDANSNTTPPTIAQSAGVGTLVGAGLGAAFCIGGGLMTNVFAAITIPACLVSIGAATTVTGGAIGLGTGIYNNTTASNESITSANSMTTERDRLIFAYNSLINNGVEVRGVEVENCSSSADCLDYKTYINISDLKKQMNQNPDIINYNYKYEQIIDKNQQAFNDGVWMVGEYHTKAWCEERSEECIRVSNGPYIYNYLTREQIDNKIISLKIDVQEFNPNNNQ